VIPLTQTGIDVTGTPDHPRGTVEYEVEGRCKPEDLHKPECVDVKEITVESNLGGDLVYVVSHLHAYSLDSILYGEDGRLICHSSPIYGHGKAAGDEEGYVVGISHCNPSFGSNGLGKIRKGEKLRYQVKYTKVAGPHTGVMGVLFLKIAEETEIITTPVATFHGNRKILNWVVARVEDGLRIRSVNTGCVVLYEECVMVLIEVWIISSIHIQYL